VQFPLYLRIPHWCDAPKVQLNGKPLDLLPRPQRFIVIDRSWSDGESVQLTLPMKINVRVWHKNHDSVSVDRGPLTYALQIGEKWQRYGGTDWWPEMEVLATSPWNYALLLDPSDPAASFKLNAKAGPVPRQPFAPKDVPIRLTAAGRRIPQWTTDQKQLLRPLQPSPVKSDEPDETITLIPMGAARLRIASFPVIGQASDAHGWQVTEK
jgi:hypothetical protein